MSTVSDLTHEHVPCAACGAPVPPAEARVSERALGVVRCYQCRLSDVPRLEEQEPARERRRREFVPELPVEKFL